MMRSIANSELALAFARAFQLVGIPIMLAGLFWVVSTTQDSNNRLTKIETKLDVQGVPYTTLEAMKDFALRDFQIAANARRIDAHETRFQMLETLR